MHISLKTTLKTGIQNGNTDIFSTDISMSYVCLHFALLPIPILNSNSKSQNTGGL